MTEDNAARARRRIAKAEAAADGEQMELIASVDNEPANGPPTRRGGKAGGASDDAIIVKLNEVIVQLRVLQEAFAQQGATLQEEIRSRHKDLFKAIRRSHLGVTTKLETVTATLEHEDRIAAVTPKTASRSALWLQTWRRPAALIAVVGVVLAVLAYGLGLIG